MGSNHAVVIDGEEYIKTYGRYGLNAAASVQRFQQDFLTAPLGAPILYDNIVISNYELDVFSSDYLDRATGYGTASFTLTGSFINVGGTTRFRGYLNPDNDNYDFVSINPLVGVFNGLLGLVYDPFGNIPALNIAYSGTGLAVDLSLSDVRALAADYQAAKSSSPAVFASMFYNVAEFLEMYPEVGAYVSQVGLNALRLRSPMAFRLLVGVQCFLEGTLVTMANGTTKPIEQIIPGDKVLSRDVQGNWTDGTVERLLHGMTTEWIELADGTNVTKGHRYFTPVEANYIAISDILKRDCRVVDANGEIFIIDNTKVYIKSSHAPQKTYNFSVSEYKNYVAGGFLVHNENCALPGEIVTGIIENGDGSFTWQLTNEFGSQIEITERDENGQTIEIERTATFLSTENAIVTKRWVSFNIDGSPQGAPEYDIRFNGEVLQPDQIGNIFGSTLGNVIAGENVFAQIGVSTALGTVLENLYEIGRTFNGDVSFIEGNPAASHDLEGHIDYNLSNFNTEFYTRLKGQAIGALSSFLVAELSESLDIGEGFGGQLFQTAGTTTVSSVLSTVVENLEDGANTLSQIFANVGDGLQLNLAAGVGGFLGGYLAREILAPQSTAGSIGGSLGGALGSSIGVSLALGQGTLLGSLGAGFLSTVGLGSFIGAFSSTLGAILLPGIGALVGTLIGTIAGDWLDEAFGDEPRAWASAQFDHATGEFYIADTWRKEGGNRKMAVQMAEAGLATLNNYAALIGGVHVAADDLAHRYGHREDKLYVNFRDGNDEINRSTAEKVIDLAVTRVAKKLRLAGGDMYLKRAIAASAATTIAELNGDLQIAQDYANYLANKDVVDLIIAADPNSAFAAGWVITLIRAEEMGITDWAKSDFYGGLAAFFKGMGLDRLGATPENLVVSVEGADLKLDVVIDGETVRSIAIEDFAAKIGYGRVAASTTGAAVTGTAGDDLWLAADAASSFTDAATATDGESNDILIGSAFNDAIDAGLGWDFVQGGAGADAIAGGSGNDNLYGGEGANDNNTLMGARVTAACHLRAA